MSTQTPVHGRLLKCASSGSAASCRGTTARLARLTKARVLAVDYRLAPRFPFPAQLLDLFLVYLAQLYLPPGSYHTAIPASKIVLAGDSSGSCHTLAVIQLILALQRRQSSEQPIVHFGGRDVRVPMPAGVALHGAEVDRSLSLPSWRSNAGIDFLPDKLPANDPARQPADDIWPSKPPRQDVLYHSSAFMNPIANPAVSKHWRGCPPLWLAFGEERCVDGGRLIASLALSQGVVVRFAEYRGLPHIFALVLPHFKQSQDCMKEWALACLELGNGQMRTSHAKIISSARQPGDTVNEVDVRKLCTFSPDEAAAMIRAGARAWPLCTGPKITRSQL